MKFDTAIFDLDGTLLNTLNDLCRCVNMMLQNNNYPTRTHDEIESYLGNGAKKLIEHSLPDGLDDATVERCLAEYRPIYAEHMNDNTQPYDGILPMLQKLKEMGFQTAVLSNKPDAATVPLCEGFFAGLIDTAMGDRPDVRRKPDAEGITILLERLHSAPERTIYIGDSEVDIRTAKNAGLTSVGVTWGYRRKEDLEAENADFLIDRPDELIGIVSND